MGGKGNPDKLQPVRSKREASERGKTGGKKSGEARREKRRLRECAELILSLPVSDVRRFNKMAAMGVPVEDIDNRMLMITALLNQACK